MKKHAQWLDKKDSRWWLMSLAMLVIIMAAAGVRLYQLGAPDLWVDEFGQAVAGSRPLHKLILLVQKHHGATPIDYLLTGLVVRISHGPGILRLPAVFWGVLAVYWIYRVGKYSFSATVGVFAAFLLAASALHIRYSQELRFYSLFLFLALVVTEALWQAWDRRTRGAWILYAALMLLTLYSHYYGLLLLGLHGVWVALRWFEEREPGHLYWQRGSSVIAFAVAACAVTIAFVPWLLYDALQEQGLSIFDAPILNQELVITVITQFSGQNPTWWPVWFFFASIGLIAQISRDRPTGIFYAAWVLASLPLIVAVDRLGNYFFHIRQVLFILPIYLVLVATGVSVIVRASSRSLAKLGLNTLSKLSQLVLLMVLALALFAMAAPQVGRYFQEDKQDRHDDWRIAISLLAENVRPGDIVISPRTEEYIKFYSEETFKRTLWVRSVGDLKTHHATGQPLWFFETPYITLVEEAAGLRQWLKTQPSLVFDLGNGFRVYYLQADRDIPGLWKTARQFKLPDRAKLWADQGYALKQDDPAAALDAFKMALALATTPEEQVDYLDAAGDLSSRLSDYNSALDYYEHVLSIQPENTEVLAKKGYMLLQLNKPSAAEEALALAIHQYGYDTYWSRRWLGVALSRLWRNDEAIPHFLKALEHDPQAHDIRFQLGNAYAQSGHREEALHWWRNYLEHDPDGVLAGAAKDAITQVK